MLPVLDVCASTHCTLPLSTATLCSRSPTSARCFLRLESGAVATSGHVAVGPRATALASTHTVTPHVTRHTSHTTRHTPHATCHATHTHSPRILSAGGASCVRKSTRGKGWVGHSFMPLARIRTAPTRIARRTGGGFGVDVPREKPTVATLARITIAPTTIAPTTIAPTTICSVLARMHSIPSPPPALLWRCCGGRLAREWGRWCGPWRHRWCGS
jgi:hypothetical protein